jgi:type IV pilus assembly protein PilC
MTTYRYQALTPDGGRHRATIESTSARAARSALALEGLHVTAIRAKKRLHELEIVPKRVKRTELMHTSRQLAAFLRAGISLLEALDTLADGTGNRRLEATLRDIHDALREGETFSEAVAAHPKVFPPVFRGMVESAELTGNLDEVLEQLAEYMERDEDVKREVRSAMIYPGVVTVMALLTVVVLSVWVMPRFESFFESLDATLPLATRMLLATTGFLGSWWWALLAGITVLALAVKAVAHTSGGRLVVHRAMLRLPLLGETIRYAIIERFCRTLGTMVSAGVSLPEAMTVAARGTNNSVYATGIHVIREGMIHGEGIAAPVEQSELFPNAMTQMVRAGEATGTLDDQLGTAATYFGQELRYKLKKLTGFFEPAVIVFVGLIVGFVAVALVSAMYGIFSQVGPT